MNNLSDAKELLKQFQEDQKKKEKEMEGKPRRGPKRKVKGGKQPKVPLKASSVITVLSHSQSSNKIEEVNDAEISQNDEPSIVPVHF